MWRECHDPKLRHSIKQVRNSEPVGMDFLDLNGNGTQQNCREKIVSEDTYNFITDFPLTGLPGLGEAFCSANVDGLYNILYVEPEVLTELELESYQYQSIPKLYGLMQVEGSPAFNLEDLVVSDTARFSPDALIASGITQVQSAPLSLTGQGCVICFIDTGIDYTREAFLDENGDSRILAIWDQSIQTGTPPAGFQYGSEYTREDINTALRTGDPYVFVPSRDEIGHGTALAGVAAGRERTGASRYTGAAPDADIVVVKLKPCKTSLRQYNLVPDGVPAYQEDDIMLAVQYANTFVNELSRPVIICLGIGTNAGDHAGNSALSRYLNVVAVRRSRAVVVCGGNEGGAAHHFRGNLLQTNNAEQNVEVRVGDNCSGFVMECWSTLPDTLQIGLRSPGGESIPPIRVDAGQSLTYRLIYANTVVRLDTTIVETSSGEQLLRFFLEDPAPGIWTFRVSGSGVLYNGTFDMWLPITQFLDAPVVFLQPDPYITMTEPAMAMDVIAVTFYNPANLSFAIDSGRGFTRLGAIRPDFSAPGVNVATPTGTQSGSGLACAITAGAVAQLFQWAVVQRRNPYAESRELKSYLIRGANRLWDLSYPNREWGYGRLNLEGVFDALIGG